MLLVRHLSVFPLTRLPGLAILATLALVASPQLAAACDGNHGTGDLRSEVRIVVKLRDATGRFVALAGDTATEDAHGESLGAAQLLDLDPDGRRLAIWDGARRRIGLLEGLDSTAPPADVTRWIRPALLRGRVTSMEWLRDGSGLAITTDHNAYIVRIDPESDAVAHPLFGGQRGRRVHDLRVMSGAIIVLADGPRTAPRAYQVELEEDRIGPARALPTDGMNVSALTVLAGGRVALALEPDWSDGADDESVKRSAEIRVLRRTALGGWTFLDSRPCEGKHYCSVETWSVGTRRLVYSTEDGSIVIAGSTPERDVTLNTGVERDSERDRPAIQTLRLNARENRVLMASTWNVQLWTRDGEQRWVWSPPQGEVHSARFAADGQTVYASAGRGVYRIRDGRAERIFRTLASEPAGSDGEYLEQAAVYIDDLELLPGGAIAYSVVQEAWRLDVGDHEIGAAGNAPEPVDLRDRTLQRDP